MATRTAESFDSNTAKLASHDMGHPQKYIHKVSKTLRYLALHNIEETAVIRRRFEAEIFLRLNVNINNSLICMRYGQFMSDLPSICDCF